MLLTAGMIGCLLLVPAVAVPVWAALGILASPPLHVIGLVFFGTEVPQVIGAVLQALGFAGCAAVLLQQRVTIPRSRPA